MSGRGKAGSIVRAIVLLILTACPASPPPSAPSREPAPASQPARPATQVAGAREVAVAKTHALYERVEAPDVDNACARDEDCHVGGCSQEICSAVAELGSACEVIESPAEGARCGCVDGQCVWYRPR